ncbi:MAG TPA: hypothetical protein VIZ68_06900 [Thermoplasmata archaeon]
MGETACGVQALEKNPIVEKELQPWFAKGWVENAELLSQKLPVPVAWGRTPRLAETPWVAGTALAVE